MNPSFLIYASLSGAHSTTCDQHININDKCHSPADVSHTRTQRQRVILLRLIFSLLLTPTSSLAMRAKLVILIISSSFYWRKKVFSPLSPLISRRFQAGKSNPHISRIRDELVCVYLALPTYVITYVFECLEKVCRYSADFTSEMSVGKMKGYPLVV